MLIVADDLTGAADTAGAFAIAGHETVVMLEAATAAVSGAGATTREPGILAVDTDGRAVAEKDAFDRTVAAVRAHPDRDVYIKIDSTLRGHVRATILGVLAAMTDRDSGRQPSRVVVCPAFPALGRTVVDGCVHVDGLPIEDGDLRPLIAAVASMADLIIADATSDGDLADLVRVWHEPERPAATLWVGSAGLARQLAMAIAPADARGATSPEQRAPSDDPTRRPAGRIVVVVGSQHDRTAAQVARLRADTRVAHIDPREPSHVDEILPVLREADGLVLTGGHTARSVLAALGVDRFAVSGEVEVGMPWSTAVGDGRAISLVTKAGGFGNEMALRRAVEFLEQPS